MDYRSYEVNIRRNHKEEMKNEVGISRNERRALEYPVVKKIKAPDNGTLSACQGNQRKVRTSDDFFWVHVRGRRNSRD